MGIASRDNAPQRRVVGGYISPAQNLQPFGFGDLLHRSAGGRGILGRLRQERDASGVAARGGQLEIDDFAQERVRDLDKDAGAVTAARLGSLGSRCSRLSSAVMALSTMSRVRRPCISTTIATPHESCSYAGLYSPTRLGVIPT